MNIAIIEEMLIDINGEFVHLTFAENDEGKLCAYVDGKKTRVKIFSHTETGIGYISKGESDRD